MVEALCWQNLPLHDCETRKLSHLCSNMLTCHYLGASAVGEYRLYPLPLSVLAYTCRVRR